MVKVRHHSLDIYIQNVSLMKMKKIIGMVTHVILNPCASGTMKGV